MIPRNEYNSMNTISFLLITRDEDEQNVVDIICHTLFDQGERSYPCVFKTSVVFSQRKNISKNERCKCR